MLALSGCGGGGGSSSTSGSGGGGPGPQSLGGSVSGLSASGLVLVNGGDTLSVASGAGSFTFGSGILYASGVTIDGNGRLYVVDAGHIWLFTP